MASTRQRSRRSITQQVIKVENRLLLKTPHLLRKDARGNLHIYSTAVGENTLWVGHGKRFYKRTLSGYLVLDTGGTGKKDRRKRIQNHSHVQSLCTSIWEYGTGGHRLGKCLWRRIYE